MTMPPGISATADREWIIRNAKGKKFVYDSAEEAFEELAEYGEGAAVFTRRVYRAMFRTKPIEEWQKLDTPVS